MGIEAESNRIRFRGPPLDVEDAKLAVRGLADSLENQEQVRK